MYQNAFGGRTPPGPAGGAYSAAQTPELRGAGGGVWKGKGEKEEGRKRRKGEDPHVNGFCTEIVPLHRQFILLDSLRRFEPARDKPN